MAPALVRHLTGLLDDDYDTFTDLDRDEAIGLAAQLPDLCFGIAMTDRKLDGRA